MSREWAAEMADKFESGDLKWTRGSMVNNWIEDPDVPCFCLTGAIAVDCGAQPVNRACSCGEEDCSYERFRLVGDYSLDPRYYERTSDLGEWIDKVDPFGTANNYPGAEDKIISMNDDGFTGVDDVVKTLRQFAADE